jgi:hypothetical protein
MSTSFRVCAAPILVTLLLAAGCQTTPKPDEQATMTGPVEDFQPVHAVSALALSSGRYPNLFSTGSRALWVSEDVAHAKLEREQAGTGEISPMLAADGATIAANFYVIELNLVSQFPDASIAYDVVGLRTVDAYLLLPDGTRVWPVQRVLGSTAQERDAGAIKVFGRTNIVAFPKTDVLLGRPTIASGTPGVQLVLDGFNSTFHFEWAADPSAVQAAAAEPEAGGLTYSALIEKLRELSRMTQ